MNKTVSYENANNINLTYNCFHSFALSIIHGLLVYMVIIVAILTRCGWCSRTNLRI